jgi:hypothetical protein
MKKGEVIMSEHKCGCTLEKIGRKKVFFWKLFLISYLLILFSWITFSLYSGNVQGLVAPTVRINPFKFNMMVLMLFGVWKILAIQFTLVPALVLTWIEYDLKKKAQVSDASE